MAGGKLTPRQKMINLMYLVFIAMLAMNMSKEVLSAFGLMNEKLEVTNSSTTLRNEAFMNKLGQLAQEQPAQYADLKAKADKVKILVEDLNSYIDNLKSEMTANLTDPKDYEIMDKADFLDSKFFKNDKISPEGQEFVNKINHYRDEVAKLVPSVASKVNSVFSTEDVTNREGVKLPWLEYHYKGFPLVASLTKLTQLQADVKNINSEVLSTMLTGEQASQLSFTNYKALVVLDKTAFFPGEKVTGKIVLGRVDENTKPKSVILNGAQMNPSSFKQGGVVLDFNAGALGQNPLKGKFIFTEEGKEVPVDFESTYTVVPRPNSATISADKMNVVYRGVVNPMTISFAGIPDNNVSASAPGLSKAGNGKYNMNPGSGTEVVINVSGKMSDGKVVTDRKTFRIKGIPGPTGTIRGEMGVVKGPKSNLEIATVGAKLLDFDFEVGLDVVGFNFKIAGQPTVVVSGNKLNAQCKSVLAKAGRGDQVTISEIKTKLVGAGSYLLPRTAPVIFEIQ
ncbi:type IX secretion system motor protein PorM/GldM [Flavobacterium agrisoli]|uniref:Gliding motility protein GldM n=1 Tax=Flavobacterium agrisoli TaxID=2793066 RepID=A0A934PP21_9FLAO|nr:gliding motility protein GldM [Flavobacterium agrisoli]MBK0370415.1 gliding motility protein GldM [Flavobacterium agrisoli]